MFEKLRGKLNLKRVVTILLVVLIIALMINYYRGKGEQIDEAVSGVICEHCGEFVQTNAPATNPQSSYMQTYKKQLDTLNGELAALKASPNDDINYLRQTEIIYKNMITVSETALKNTTDKAARATINAVLTEQKKVHNAISGLAEQMEQKATAEQ